MQGERHHRIRLQGVVGCRAGIKLEGVCASWHHEWVSNACVLRRTFLSESANSWQQVKHSSHLRPSRRIKAVYGPILQCCIPGRVKSIAHRCPREGREHENIRSLNIH